MKLQDYCCQLSQQLGQLPSEQRTERAARALQSAFKVADDEVAVFAYDAKLEVLRFVWPPALQNSGVIPPKAVNSLVAKTARNGRGYLNNSFSKTAHGVIFELSAKAGSSRPIQKIMSAPLQTDGALHGVVQICRKGENSRQAGADFQARELEALEQIATALAPHL